MDSPHHHATRRTTVGNNAGVRTPPRREKTMKLADQLEEMGVHVEVKCPDHMEPDKSHTLTEYCDEHARIQWVQMRGSITKTPEEGWKENRR